MDIVAFHPGNLQGRTTEELRNLTPENIKVLAERYPFMNPDLRIARKNDKKIVSPATWKSLNALLKAGHPFEIVGTKWGEPKKSIEQIVESVQPLAQAEYIQPEKPIFQQPKGKPGRPKKQPIN
jgi:hypothetical protein